MSAQRLGAPCPPMRLTGSGVKAVSRLAPRVAGPGLHAASAHSDVDRRTHAVALAGNGLIGQSTDVWIRLTSGRRGRGGGFACGRGPVSIDREMPNGVTFATRSVRRCGQRRAERDAQRRGLAARTSSRTRCRAVPPPAPGARLGRRQRRRPPRAPPQRRDVDLPPCARVSSSRCSRIRRSSRVRGCMAALRLKVCDEERGYAAGSQLAARAPPRRASWSRNRSKPRLNNAPSTGSTNHVAADGSLTEPGRQS